MVTFFTGGYSIDTCCNGVFMFFFFLINMLIFEKVSLLSFFTVLFNKSLFFVPCKIDFAADSLTHTANRPLPIYTARQFQNEFPDAPRLSFKTSSQIHCASISKRVRVQNFHKKMSLLCMNVHLYAEHMLRWMVSQRLVLTQMEQKQLGNGLCM